VTRTTSGAAVKAADQILAAEQKLTASQAARNTLYRERTKVQRELDRLNASITESDRRSPTAMRPINDALKRRAEVTAQIGRINEQIARDREQISNRTIALTNLESSADRKAAEERLKHRRQIIALDQQSVAIQQRAD